MLNKGGKIIYIAFFFIICLIPVLSMPFFSSESDSGSENRTKAELPEISNDEGLNLQYFSELDTYLSDNFNFRSDFVNLNSLYFESVFGVSAQPKVVVGKDDFLFYHDTVDDFLGLHALSESDIQRISKTLSLMEEYVSSVGSEFLFFVAPNKNSIYPEYMPDNYLKSENISSTKSLYSSLSPDIYLDMHEVLSESDELVYYKKDTHWNNRGAYIGFSEILDNLSITEQNFSIVGEEIRQDYDADLLGMLYPSAEIYDEQIHYEFDSSYEFISRFNSTEDLIIETHNENGSGSALVFRDSFGNALFDYFALQFEELYYSRVVPYSLDLAPEYDYVVIEIVERNLVNLLSNAAVIPAPKREISEENLNMVSAQISTEAAGNLTNYYGTVGQDSYPKAIYAKVDGEFYEAFPVCETGHEYDGLVYFSFYLESETENIEIFFEI